MKSGKEKESPISRGDNLPQSSAGRTFVTIMLLTLTIVVSLELESDISRSLWKRKEESSCRTILRLYFVVFLSELLEIDLVLLVGDVLSLRKYPLLVGLLKSEFSILAKKRSFRTGL